jgi:hypothetical protein
MSLTVTSTRTETKVKHDTEGQRARLQLGPKMGPELRIHPGPISLVGLPLQQQYLAIERDSVVIYGVQRVMSDII